MNREQALQALRDKLREIDLDDGLVGVISINSQEKGTLTAGFQSRTNFYAVQCAELVLDIAYAIKLRLGRQK